MFASGPLAGVACGCEVVGASDAEPRCLRSKGMSAVWPESQHRSLTMLSLLEGDLPRRASVAPIVRWAKGPWSRQTQAFESAPRIAEMRNAWEECLFNGKLVLGQSEGPCVGLADAFV
eukprot:8165080-Pyramimonas_sp.AAC.1